MSAVRIRVIGRVQGVDYRRWLQDSASDAGLSGWVRNRSDGSVEAVLFGDASTVDSVITLARSGPSYAAVTDILVEAAGSDSIERGRFVVLPTD